MKNGKLQSKDIPDEPILRMLAAREGWHTVWTWNLNHPGTDYMACPDCNASMPSLVHVMPRNDGPEVEDDLDSLRTAKMASLKRRGLVDGCACGCRGDWEITDAGRSELERQERE